MADPLEMKIEDFSSQNQGTRGTELTELPPLPDGLPKEYMGDGVYAEFDGWSVKLTAENGICATNTIYLDPYTLRALMKYAAKFS